MDYPPVELYGFNIGVLHTAVEGHASYASKGYDHWDLRVTAVEMQQRAQMLPLYS